MCTARPSWMSISQQSLGYKDNMYKVAVGDLQDILKIDKDNLLVTVQPGVTIGLLNRFGAFFCIIDFAYLIFVTGATGGARVNF